ncbi:hypothetical protein [Pseudobutyrivibrio xylanivorans]|uniref:RES domain-containing protein n=1 Tax=Pseudobutyrivibrio xylanivorans TaxID=185007 RepID=A0A5P6VND2_PSEXY|nr:hypothetical protein [Pseudobutyrivibrio xylanivorans]QFJ53930.1 hypothetical protein FXF36_03135 [Pseudobutyrivibrio xylanivorans]
MDYEIVRLPYEIGSDADYINAFDKCMRTYKKWVAGLFEDRNGIATQLSITEKQRIINAIRTDGGIIKNCISRYYAGDIATATKRIGSLLERIILDDKNGFIKSDIDKNYCSRLCANYPFLNINLSSEQIKRMLDNELTFFRARKEYFTDYSEMYHIPLDKRDLVGTERFSVPGIPCLYLGTSVYDVWLEMGRPAYSDFNVSAIKLTEKGKKMQILNLVATPYLLLGLNSPIGDENNMDSNLSIIKSLLRIYPLVIATSIRNKSPRGKFRSDYIISHLIMLNLKKLGIDGVAYLSKRILSSEEDIVLPQMVNVAFPAFESSSVNEKYGEICEKIQITRPANYEEFLSLELGSAECLNKNSYFAKTFDDNQNLYSCVNRVKISGKDVVYQNTGFYRFENHLCEQKFYKL